MVYTNTVVSRCLDIVSLLSKTVEDGFHAS